MDRLVATATNDQGLAPASRHQPHPRWDLFAPLAFEVGEFANVVDFDPARAATQFAFLGLEPFEEVRAFGIRLGWLLVNEDGVLPAFEREAPELCY